MLTDREKQDIQAVSGDNEKSSASLFFRGSGSFVFVAYFCLTVLRYKFPLFHRK
jgi:hypothetical protein